MDEFLLIAKAGQTVGQLLADPKCFSSASQIGVQHHQVPSWLSACMSLRGPACLSAEPWPDPAAGAAGAVASPRQLHVRLAALGSSAPAAVQIQTKQDMGRQPHWEVWHTTKKHSFNEVLAQYTHR